MAAQEASRELDGMLEKAEELELQYEFQDRRLGGNLPKEVIERPIDDEDRTRYQHWLNDYLNERPERDRPLHSARNLALAWLLLGGSVMARSASSLDCSR